MAKTKVKTPTKTKSVWDRQAGNDNAKAIREAGKKRYGGLTARQYRAANSKFKAEPKARQGNFEIAAMFYGNDMPQRTTFPNIAAAASHFEKISKNADLSVIKLIEYIPVLDKNGKPTNQNKVVVICQLNKTNQTFCNSKTETIYRRPGVVGLFGMKAIEKSPTLMQAFTSGQLEVARQRSEGGQAWWESSR